MIMGIQAHHLQVLTDTISTRRSRREAVDRGARLASATSMPMKDIITEKLRKAFAPQSLDVLDESDNHIGHAGHRPGGETHFRIDIVADAFRGKSRIERHRMINQTLSGELAGSVHALAIHAGAPGEH